MPHMTANIHLSQGPIEVKFREHPGGYGWLSFGHEDEYSHVAICLTRSQLGEVLDGLVAQYQELVAGDVGDAIDAATHAVEAQRDVEIDRLVEGNMAFLTKPEGL